jgi:hypothetical protein
MECALYTNRNCARKKERHLTKYDPQAEMTTDFTTRFPNSTEVVWYVTLPRTGPIFIQLIGIIIWMQVTMK